MQGLEEDASEVEVKMMKWTIVGLGRRKLVLSIWLEEDVGIEDKVPHSYWETLLVDLPLQEEEV